MSPIWFLFVFFHTTKCNGYMELHLQSPFQQSATVYIPEKSLKIPVVLEKFPMNITRIPVNFDKTYNVTIHCGASKEEGLTEASIIMLITPSVGLLSPSAVPRPLNGIRVIIRCNQNWYGEKCDKFCKEKKTGKKCNFEGKLACSNGFFGEKCDRKNATCSCENNGKCVDSSPSPVCKCPLEFRGEKCEKKQKMVSLTSTYKGDFWNFRMTFWQLILSNLVENQLAENRKSTVWQEIFELLGKSSQTPFNHRPNGTATFPFTGTVNFTTTE